ncbi:hypothetical protein GF336_04165 [Candidatus Woesearchaeota archaeon]|nr:hypothetical protein [Candidatus Woesearchaeota archaeon]
MAEKDFVEMMLKKAKEKKETEAQDRTGNTGHREIEDLVESIREWKQKKKE